MGARCVELLPGQLPSAWTKLDGEDERDDAAGNAGDADRRTQKRHDSSSVAARHKHAFGGLSVRFFVGQSVRNLQILYSLSAHGRPALAHPFFMSMDLRSGKNNLPAFVGAAPGEPGRSPGPPPPTKPPSRARWSGSHRSRSGHGWPGTRPRCRAPVPGHGAGLPMNKGWSPLARVSPEMFELSAIAWFKIPPERANFRRRPR
jgi:hypothetical protein